MVILPQSVHSDLEFQVKENMAKSLDLRERIMSLWALLEVSEEDRQAFLATAPGHTPSNLAKVSCASLPSTHSPFISGNLRNSLSASVFPITDSFKREVFKAMVRINASVFVCNLWNSLPASVFLFHD